MKITKIEIKNFRGIAAREIAVGAGGFVASGKNGGGKSSILNAIRAALCAQDIGPDAIRNGTDKAEILIDLGDMTVRRAIGKKSSSVSITSADGFQAKKPQHFLTELLGTSPLDPLDLFLAKPKERRAQILNALPVTVTVEQLREWIPDLPQNVSVDGHGLEVVGRLRQVYYDRRTIANKAADDAGREHERLKQLVGPVVACPALPIAEAEMSEAKSEAQRIEMRKEEARRALVRTASSRERIAKLREEALALNEMPVPSGNLFAEELVAATAHVVACQKQLDDAVEACGAIVLKQEAAKTAISAYTAASDKAALLSKQANELSAALQDAVVADVSDDEVVAAAERVALAESNLQKSRLARANENAIVDADLAAAKSKHCDDEAARLDNVVLRLSNEAPAALLKTSNGIPGLSLDGDDIVLRGVRMDSLCGAEKMALAIGIARSANAKSKILVVDGLERIDLDQQESFVRMATRDGYQMIATRVDRGDVVIEAIEPDQPETSDRPAAAVEVAP